MTALHCVAMAQYESIEIAQLLVKYKCPINENTIPAGETPFFLACNSGYAELVEYLMKLGVDPNKCSASNRTCFQQAVFRGHKNVILLLLNNGYHLTEDDKIDMNLLIMDLFQDNDKDMLKYLLDKKLASEKTILKCAKEFQKFDCVDDSAPIRKDVESASDITNIEQLEVYLGRKLNIS